MRFRSWGHKCCHSCGSKEGELRRCSRCHHHVHCDNEPEDDLHPPCYDWLAGRTEFVCWSCALQQRSEALRIAR
eukprot:2684260-Amphidinium_carterae.1